MTKGMTPTLQAPELTRRGVLSGLGGMTFCLALGTDGVSLVSEAQANALANAQVTPWVRIAPDGTTYGYKDPFSPAQLMWIVGSRATQLYYNDLRKAGAQVRKVLIANAAQ